MYEYLCTTKDMCGYLCTTRDMCGYLCKTMVYRFKIIYLLVYNVKTLSCLICPYYFPQKKIFLISRWGAITLHYSSRGSQPSPRNIFYKYNYFFFNNSTIFLSLWINRWIKRSKNFLLLNGIGFITIHSSRTN